MPSQSSSRTPTRRKPTHARPASPSKAEMQRFIMRMPKELHRQLRFLSIDRSESLNSMIVRILEEWWRTQPEFGKFPE